MIWYKHSQKRWLLHLCLQHLPKLVTTPGQLNELKIQHLCMCCTFIHLCQCLAKVLSCTAFGCFSKHFLLNMIYGAVVARWSLEKTHYSHKSGTIWTKSCHVWQNQELTALPLIPEVQAGHGTVSHTPPQTSVPAEHTLVLATCASVSWFIKTGDFELSLRWLLSWCI